GTTLAIVITRAPLALLMSARNASTGSVAVNVIEDDATLRIACAGISTAPSASVTIAVVSFGFRIPTLLVQRSSSLPRAGIVPSLIARRESRTGIDATA